MTSSLLLRNVRLVPVRTPGGMPDGRRRAGETAGGTAGGTAGETVIPVPGRPVDVRIRDGVVTEVGSDLAADGTDSRAGKPDKADAARPDVLDLEGRFLVPGLWDAHVHFDQWAATLTRLDMAGTRDPAEAVARVAGALAARRASGDGAGVPAGGSAAADEPLVGFGHRTALWSREATVAELDAVSGPTPVVLISGDAHNGWLNTAALRRLGLPARDTLVEEREWFDVMPRLEELTGPVDHTTAFADAAAKGVVGIGDMEFGGPFRNWSAIAARCPGGVPPLRVRACTYPTHLDAALAAGLRTGDVLPGTGERAVMGPLKIISDGSLNTRTAWCHEPYADGRPDAPRGVRNYGPEELTELVRTAADRGLGVAVHAIGDAAVAAALDAFEASGARGSIEHAQLVAREDAARMARAGVVASVQPAHLLDDRDVTATCWPDRADRSFALASLRAAGVRLALGSDAPVAALDPWLAMAAAVHRSADERDPWNPAEALTPAQALAASTDGRGTVRAGSVADLAVLDADPLGVTVRPADPASLASPPDPATTAEAARVLSDMRVAATLVGGEVTHLAL